MPKKKTGEDSGIVGLVKDRSAGDRGRIRKSISLSLLPQTIEALEQVATESSTSRSRVVEIVLEEAGILPSRVNEK